MITTVLFFFEKDFTREIGGHKSKCSWRAFATCCCNAVHNVVVCSRRALNVRWMLIHWQQKPTWLGDRQTMTFVLWQMASSITSYWMHTAFFLIMKSFTIISYRKVWVEKKLLILSRHYKIFILHLFVLKVVLLLNLNSFETPPKKIKKER